MTTIKAETNGRRVTSREMLTKPRTGALSVPFADIDTLESIATGFRMEMFELTDDGKPLGSVETGSGLGTDFITLNWGDRKAIVRGIDLLRAWVRTFDPDEAKRMPPGLSRRKAARRRRGFA
jgi:hypothetical protein